MNTLRDEFLSEEDLDLRHLSRAELDAYWNQWLEQAQTTNDQDCRSYSHGVFVLMEEPTGLSPVDLQRQQDRRRVAESPSEYGTRRI